MFNITNSSEHPTRPADDDIWFEVDIDVETEKTIYFFGIKNRDLKIVTHKNYLVSGKYRKPIISNTLLRWVLPIISLTIITLAIIGFLKSKT